LPSQGEITPASRISPTREMQYADKYHTIPNLDTDAIFATAIFATYAAREAVLWTE